MKHQRDNCNDQKQMKHSVSHMKGDTEHHPSQEKDESEDKKKEAAHGASISSQAVELGITQLLQNG